MKCCDHAANLGPESMSQGCLSRIDGCHLDSKHAERCSHLATDEAETDDYGPPPSASGGLDPLGVFHCAQVKNAFSVCAWKPQGPLAPAGGDQYSVVRNDFVAFEANPFEFGFKLDHLLPEHEVDSEPLVFASGRNQRAFARFGASKKPFG